MWSSAILVTVSVVVASAVQPFWNDGGNLPTIACPDGSTTCPNNSTCCPNCKVSGYNCCPMLYASCCPDEVHCCFSKYPICCSDGHCCSPSNPVCCSDGSHCCPEGNRCDGATCVSESGAGQGEISVAAVLGMKAHTRKDAEVKTVVCPDGSSQCMDRNTCCMLSSGNYGCCPVPHANCCADKVHCCPEDYTCEADGCIKEGKFHPMMELLLSPVSHKEV